MYRIYLLKIIHVTFNNYCYYCLLQISGSILQYARDSLTTIVFTSTEFNICLMYDTLIGLHSVWKIRKPTDEVMYFIKIKTYANMFLYLYLMFRNAILCVVMIQCILLQIYRFILIIIIK